MKHEPLVQAGKRGGSGDTFDEPRFKTLTGAAKKLLVGLTVACASASTAIAACNLNSFNTVFPKGGQLLRADFAEGSCTNPVLENVKARRTQGEVRASQTEKSGTPARKFEGKSPRYPQQGTDSANQDIVKPAEPANGGPSVTPQR